MSFTPPCFQSSAGIPPIPGALPVFVAVMASNSSLTSGFSLRDAMFGLSAVVSNTERSTSQSSLSFLLHYCLTIKVSKLCCTPLLCPIYLCQIILKVLSYLFFLLPLPPIFETSFPWCTALDSVEYQSVLSCLI